MKSKRKPLLLQILYFTPIPSRKTHIQQPKINHIYLNGHKDCQGGIFTLYTTVSMWIWTRNTDAPDLDGEK